MKTIYKPTTSPQGTFFCSEEEIPELGDRVTDGNEVWQWGEVKHFSLPKVIKYQLQSDNIIEGVPVVPLEDDVEKLAEKWIDNYTLRHIRGNNVADGAYKVGFIAGYKQSKQDKRFLEAIEFLKQAQNEIHLMNGDMMLNKNIHNFIASIQPQIDFIEVEMEENIVEKSGIVDKDDSCLELKQKPTLFKKTINGVETTCVKCKIVWK